MVQTVIHNSFSTGEISPKLFGRTDLAKQRNAATTLRNCCVDYRGGVFSRAGTAYVGMCKQGAPNSGGTATANPPRDIPFQFNIYQGFVLEFGDQYMRIKSQGAYVTEAAKSITAITKANPAVFTLNAHGYNNGDWIYIASVAGMTNFNGLTWVVANKTTNTFQVTDLFGNAIDSTAYAAYTSGGTAARIYTVVSPYAAIDLPYLKFTQSENVMSLTCVNQATGTEYPTYDLARLGNTNWTFTAVTFATNISAPTGVAVTAQASTTLSTWYTYAVTAVDAATGQESVASSSASVENNNISINAGSNTITWSPVTGAASYNIYACTAQYGGTGAIVPNIGAPFGLIGSAFGVSFTDTNIIPNFNITPPTHNDPFARGAIIDVTPTAGGSGMTQGGIGYSITTSTGSGFSGTPIVVNGAFTGFLIVNGGKLYAPGDTISITGGTTNATGAYTFTGNPTNTQTIMLNGVAWAFTTGAPGADKTVIENTVASTLAALVVDLNASADAAINVASYALNGLVLTITYKVGGAGGNAYTLAAGTYGGAVSGAHLTGGATGGGATASLTVGAAAKTYPGDVTYYQQRRVYAYTLNQPDTYFMSKTGAFKNMDSSIPSVANDAIIGSPWAQQINGIQFMVPMQTGLVIFTGNSAWLLSGGTSAAVTPADQTAVSQSFNGCSAIVPPIVIDYDILYVQSKGSIVCDLAYNFFVNVYTGTDRTVFSSQLFDNHSILQWAWAREPNKIVWAVRDDGVMLSLTYFKESNNPAGDIYGWARHDTNGLFTGVCSITEKPMADVNIPTQLGPLTDAVYTIVKRMISGQAVYYAERMDDRNWSDSEDCWCVDAGLAYPQNYPQTTMQASASTGTGVTFTAGSSVFTGANVGDVIRTGGGIATITAYVSGTVLTGNITQGIAQVVLDGAGTVPIIQTAGEWSITTPVSSVSGLNHLEGQTVTGLADGNVIPPAIVTNGTIALQQPSSAIVIGMAFLPQLQGVYIDPPSQEGTVQTKRVTINSVAVRMVSSRGISVGTNQVDSSTQQNSQTVAWSRMTEIKQNILSSNPTNAIPLFTGDYFLNVQSGWDQHGQVAIQQNYPLPLGISALVSYINVGG